MKDQWHNLTTIGCVGGDVDDLQENNLMETMTVVMVRKIDKCNLIIKWEDNIEEQEQEVDVGIIWSKVSSWTIRWWCWSSARRQLDEDNDGDNGDVEKILRIWHGNY